jgi:hypothetical protein
MLGIPQISIMVIERLDDFANLLDEDMFLAYVITNPNIRAEGISEAEAIEKLKKLIVRDIPRNKYAKMTNITLDDLIIEEIHES